MKRIIFKEDSRIIPLSKEGAKPATEWYMETYVRFKNNQIIRDINELQHYLENAIKMTIVLTAINTIAILVLGLRNYHTKHHNR